jgi:tRNA dimethylallyltransferase
MSKPLLIIIAGPTGVGKTNLAIQVAKELNTEIISADSRQIYKEMSIGTAVPSADDLLRIKHYFIQTQSIHEGYNASKYEFEALEKLNHLFKKYPYLVMAGGSGMYIDAVCHGIDDLPSIPPHIRNQYKSIFESEGLNKLQVLVRQIDPVYFKKVDQNNPKRLLKALEVFEATGKPYSSFLKHEQKQRFFDTLKIVLDLPRPLLYERINKRVEDMVKSGLEQEARSLFKFKGLTPLKTVGYREFFEYFDGMITRSDAIEQIKNHSRAYARRQLTWFRRYEDAHWHSPDDIHKVLTCINTNSTNNEDQ